MPYLLIEDGFADNSKITGLSMNAYRLHVTALVMCAKNMTDGSISKIGLRWTSDHAQIARPKRYVTELIQAGLWVANGDGWKIHDYLEHNPSRAEIEAKRKAAKLRKRRHDARRNGVTERVTERVSNASGNASKDPPQRALKGSLEAEPFKGSPLSTPTTDQRRAAALADAEQLARTWNIPDSEAFADALEAIEHTHGIGIRALDRERLWDTASNNIALAGRTPEPPAPPLPIQEPTA